MSLWKARNFIIGMFLVVITLFSFGCDVYKGDIGRYSLHNFGKSENEGVMMIDTKTGVAKLIYYRNSNGELTRDKLGLTFNEMPAQ